MLGNTIREYVDLEETILVICRACGHERELDLVALVAAGYGDRELIGLRLVCNGLVTDQKSFELVRCCSRRVGFSCSSRNKATPTLEHLSLRGRVPDTKKCDG